MEDIPRNIPRNIRNNILKNNTFNYDSFALENKTVITKDIPGNIPRNIRNNILKNNTFNYDSFALENKTMIHMGKHSLNSRRIMDIHQTVCFSLLLKLRFYFLFSKLTWKHEF